jgi:hypothetical protein
MSWMSLDRPAAEHVQGLRLRGADLGELRGVVELAELGVHLVHELALVVALESRGCVLPAHVVRREEQHALDSLRGDVLPRRLAVGFARPGGGEEERAALRAGELRRTCVGRDVEHLRRDRVGRHGEHDVGEHAAGEEIDLVEAQVALGELLRVLRLELVVADEHFGGKPAQLAAVQLDRQVEAVADVAADRRVRPGQRADEADLHFVGRLRAERGRNQDCEEHGSHRVTLSTFIFGSTILPSRTTARPSSSMVQSRIGTS